MNRRPVLRPGHPAHASLAFRPRLAPRWCAGAALLALALPATGVAAPPSACADHLAEAARVSGLPEELVASVLMIESRGRSAAISPAGAMGCMQIMPATWGALTTRYALGSDVYDPRANMIGGALYLREMIDRYGLPGAFAAYNAGPGRYEAWRDTGRRLPTETINYVARLAPVSRQPGAAPAPIIATLPAPDWKQSMIFVAFAVPQTGARDRDNISAVSATQSRADDTQPGRYLPQLSSPAPLRPRSDGLFAVFQRP